MIKFNNLGTSFNSLGIAKYNLGLVGDNIILPQLLTRVGVRPIILSEDIKQIAILENAFDIYLDQEIKGIDELTFSIPTYDDNFQHVKNEALVQMFDTVYIMREINVDRNSLRADVFCEAVWYDIAYGTPLTQVEWKQRTHVREILESMLVGSGWRISGVGNFSSITLSLDVEDNRLSALRKLESKIGGELIFDTKRKVVSIVTDVIQHTGASIMYDKNADNIKATYDTRELITKIYPYGAEGLTIKDANNGVEYLENYSYTGKVRIQPIKDDRYTNPYELKEMCERALNELSKPRASYVITMKDMTEKSGLEHERFFIGGLVRVYDKELNLNTDTRIMKWKLNVTQPENSDINLEYKAKSISELLTGTNNHDSQFSSETSAKGYSELSIFNQLMNSRADDGFLYWSNNGFTIDASEGGSGDASFKAVGNASIEKRITQTIYPSNNNSYAISLKATTKDLVLNPNSKLGVEVKMTYDDGSTETKFVSLAGGN